MIDVELDERITALEENNGGSSQNGNLFKLKSVKVAFDWMLDFTNCMELFNANIRLFP